VELGIILELGPFIGWLPKIDSQCHFGGSFGCRRIGKLEPRNKHDQSRDGGVYSVIVVLNNYAYVTFVTTIGRDDPASGGQTKLYLALWFESNIGNSLVYWHTQVRRAPRRSRGLLDSLMFARPCLLVSIGYLRR
jgi:hypothetical protein